MRQKAYLYISSLIFAVVGISHVLRAFYQIPVRAGNWEFPIGFSWVGGAVALGLCAWGISLARK